MLISLTANYDKEFDILYVRLTPYPASYGDEDDNGVVTLRSIADDSTSGMIIYDFKKRLENKEITSLDLPFAIDLRNPSLLGILAGQHDYKCTLVS